MIEGSIAVISDIHGNRWALEAVLADIKRRGIQRIINLGDSFYDPLDPAGTFQMLTNNNILSILGNEDHILLEPSEENADSPSLLFTKQNLNSEVLHWLRKLKSSTIVNNDFFICHGSPKRDDEYLLEEVRKDALLLKSSQNLMMDLSALEQEVILCGHSHFPRTVSLPTGQLIVNPGSVGLSAYSDDLPYPHSIETGSPHARYAILSPQEHGCSIAHMMVLYTWATASAVALANGRSDWEKWLREGRV